MQIAQLVATSGADLMSMLPFLQVEAAQTAEIAGAEDFSVMSLIIRAGPVVKAVMAILLVMSVWSWAIAFDKWFGVGAARSKAKAFEKAFWSGQPLDEMDDRVSSRPSEALARVFSAGSREWRDSRRSPPCRRSLRHCQQILRLRRRDRPRPLRTGLRSRRLFPQNRK